MTGLPGGDHREGFVDGLDAVPPELSRDLHRRHRVCLAALRGAGWDRAAAEAGVRVAAAAALERAAAALRQGAEDDRVRALVDRALRRLSLAADLETDLTEGAIVLARADVETHGLD